MTSGVNTKKSVKKIAVLFTDIIGSTSFFKAHGNLAGRKMLQQHEDIVSKEITEFGGTVVKNIGDSILAYFVNPQEATKVAIQIQKEFNLYNNKQKDADHKIYVRIGIHFDEGVVEDKDIFGNAVNIASKITDLAGSNEIFISHDVFALVNTVPSLEFKSVEIPDKNKASVESAAYQVLWDKSIDFDPTLMSVIYMRPVRKLDVGNFDTLWDNLIKTKALFWESNFFRNNLINDKDPSVVPVQIIIDAGPCLEIDRLAREGFKPDWEGFRPGTIFMSPAAYDLIKKEQSLSIVPSTSPGADQPQSFHEIALDEYQQKEDMSFFLYQNALNKGLNSSCFYCSSKDHATQNCPSKHLAEMTRSLNKLGYLSFDKINNIFLAYLMSSEEAKQKAVELPEKSHRQEPSTALGFYELKQVFQLRFFKTIWNNQGNEWSKITETNEENEDKGGVLWLAQDSLRVSKLSQAESLLQTCLEKYPGDYRTYCALGFLNIEKNKHSRTEQYLDKALYYARTKPQKIFILLLLSRFYDLAGDSANALKKTREINILYPFCTEAAYQEIIFKFKQGKEDEALKQLIKLIRTNREYYINALTDPDLAPFNPVIHPKLKELFTENRQKAQKAAFAAEKEFSTLKKFLEKTDDEIKKADAVLSKIKELALTDSYFGYLDMVYLGDSLTSAFSKIMSRRKKKLINTIKKTYRRIGNIFSLTGKYHSRFVTNSAYKQLKNIQSELKQISGAVEFNHFDKFLEMSIRCEEISKELDEIEPELKRLKTMMDIKTFLIIFFKNSVFILSIILFAGIIIFPALVYYLNTFSPEFNISTAGDTGFYHKYFIIFGVVGGLFFSFFKSFQSFLNR